MTNQVGAQATPPPGVIEIVEARRLRDDFRQKIYQMIEWRAYNLFEEHGCNHGNDIWDWLTAEDELTFKPVTPPPAESEERFRVFVETPGFLEGQLKIALTPHSVIIAGERGPVAQVTPGDGLYSGSHRPRIFLREIGLSHEIDPSGVTARLDHGILIIDLPKLRR